jgi:D-inositol-3-phosphate glycosyltransferase
VTALADTESAIPDQRHDVLLVSHYYPPHVGGIEQVASAEATGLSDRGSEVTVLTSGPGARRTTSQTEAGVTVLRTPASNLLERFGVPFPLFAPIALLRRGRAQVRGSTIVHVHDTLYLSSWAAALWCRLLKRPLVVTQHVSIVAHPWRVVALVQRVVYRTLGRFIWDTATVILYLNNGVRDSLLKQGVPAQRLTPLMNGVDLESFRPVSSSAERDSLRDELGLPRDRSLVLFVGRLVPKKGYQHLVDAAGSQDRWTAVLVGDGNDVAPGRNVIMLGALDREHVAQAYRACDAFTLPSEAEGFPLTIQEAMASGLPIITTDDPGYGMYGLDRTLVELLPANGRGLGSAIDRVLDDPGRQNRMSAYSRQFAEQAFSWHRHVDALLAVYATAGPGPNRPDRLTRNAGFLMGSTAITALLGLAFWSAAARLYSVSQIGIATSLISAVALLAYLALFGLNGSLIRFLPSTHDPQRQVSAVLTVAGLAAVLTGVGYVMLLPVIAARAARVASGPGFATLFLAVVICAAINQATDSVFIAYREAQWNSLVDGLIQGVAKLVPLFLVASAGAVGVFVSYGVGCIAAALASLLLIRGRLKLRLRPTLRPAALRGYLAYSASSYASSLLNLAPLLVLPLIALSRLGSSAAGYYYIAFQIATLLHAISFAIGESMFAEASHAPEDVPRLARKSARLTALILVPAAAVVILLAPRLMALFGPEYVAHGTDVVRLLAAGSLAVAANSWTSFLLKIHGAMRVLVASNAVYCAVACGGAILLAPLGIEGIATAWIAANLASALVALPALELSFSFNRRFVCASFK